MPKTKRNITGAIIVAAGTSRRMGETDKILLPLAGKPVLLRALEPFLENRKINRIVLVLNRRNLRAARALLETAGLLERVAPCLGGKRRQDSVLAGLKKLGKCDWVVIHDCARPLATPDLIECGLQAAKETGAATAGVPVTDTIKLADNRQVVRRTMHRENLWQTQTPQVFRYDVLAQAFQYNERDVTDEAQLVELTGVRVRIYQGAYDNIKITTPADLAIAEALLAQRKG